MFRRGRDQLIFRALLVLDEAVSACRDTPVYPSLGQRFALMFLYAVSDGDRSAYDGFWHAVQDRQEANNEEMGRGMRQTSARTCLTSIARGVGVEFSVHYQNELRLARMPQREREALRQRDAELSEHRRRLREEGWEYEASDRAKAVQQGAAGIDRAGG